MSLKLMNKIGDLVFEIKTYYEIWWESQPENICNRENTLKSLKETEEIYSVLDEKDIIKAMFFYVFMCTLLLIGIAYFFTLAERLFGL